MSPCHCRLSLTLSRSATARPATHRIQKQTLDVKQHNTTHHNTAQHRRVWSHSSSGEQGCGWRGGCLAGGGACGGVRVVEVECGPSFECDVYVEWDHGDGEHGLDSVGARQRHLKPLKQLAQDHLNIRTQKREWMAMWEALSCARVGVPSTLATRTDTHTHTHTHTRRDREYVTPSSHPASLCVCLSVSPSLSSPPSGRCSSWAQQRRARRHTGG